MNSRRLTPVWLVLFLALIFQAHALVQVPYEAPGNGYLSLALVNSEGVLVRTLLAAAPVTAGSHTVVWDGASDLGVPQPAGTYTTRAIFFTTPPSLSYQMKVGVSGNPPYRTTDGRGDWGGNLGGPSGIAANNDSVIVTWSAVEDFDITGVQQIDGNGNILQRYATFYLYDGRMAAAMDANQFFLGILNPWDERMEIGVYNLGQREGSILTHLPTPPHSTASGRWKGRWATWMDGLAVNSDTVFATVALDNVLYLINRSGGSIRQQVTLNAPRGIAVSGDRLVVVSGTSVLKLRLDGGVESTLVPAGVLVAPNAIAVDSTGNIYVGDSGARILDPEAELGQRQVFVFDSSGTLLRRIGKLGGTPRNGRYDPTGFGEIRGLAIGAGNKLWVQDEVNGFKRTSRWSLDGQLEREWFGRKLTHFSDNLNPARPNELLYVADTFDDSPGITAYELDWANRTWRPAWNYSLNYAEMYQEDVYLSHAHTSNPLQELQPGARYPVFHYAPGEYVTHQGRNYFITREGNGEGAIFTYGPDQKPQPVALIGYHRVEIITNKVVSYYDSGPNTWFTWADRNGDGRMATNEMIFTSDLPTLETASRVFAARLLPNLNIIVQRPKNGQMVESILPLKELLPNGVPVYDWSMLNDLPARQLPNLNGGAGGKPVEFIEEETVPTETADAWYTILSPTTSVPLSLPGIDNFWANRNWRKRIAKFDKQTGRVLWTVGRRAPGRALNGEMYHPNGLLGISGEALFATDVLSVVWVWTTDGLYLGRLYNDTNPGKTFNENAIHAELLGPVTIYTDPGSGRIYSIANDTGALIHEVHLPAVQKLTARTVTLTPAEAALVRAWDPDTGEPSAVLPALRVQFSPPNTLTLFWSSLEPGFLVQESTTPMGTWGDLGVQPELVGSQYRVTLGLNGPQRFYRLIRP